MSRRDQSTHLPLLLSGLPEPVPEWLRAAGVPIARFASNPPPNHNSWDASGNILLFDARTAGGRLDARTARECGAEVINVADLLKSTMREHQGDASEQVSGPAATRDGQSDCAAFLGGLKQRVERVGGFWLRLADYPFPYRTAIGRRSASLNDLPVFAGRQVAIGESLDPDDGRHGAERDGTGGVRFDPPAEIRSPHRATRRELTERLRERYESGLPLFLDEADDPEAANHSEMFDKSAAERPLTWRTTEHEFNHWWQVRSRLKIVAHRTGTTYRIECEGEFAGYRPMLELWLGTHVASFPLFAETMNVREDGVVFVREQRKHPGGLAAAWPLQATGDLTPALTHFSEDYTPQPV